MRFALVCPPYASHIAAFEAIGEALLARGHDVAIMAHGGVEPDLTLEGASFLALPGHRADLETLWNDAGGRNGAVRLWKILQSGARATADIARHAPALLRREGIEALLVDEMEPGGGLVARSLGLPFLSVACSLPVEGDPALPPPYIGWPYDPSRQGLKRNRGGRRVADLVLAPQRLAIRRAAAQLGVQGAERLEDCLSPLATLSQTSAEFDFPRADGTRVRPLGPFRRVRPVSLFAPRERRPLVYASFGTMQGHRLDLFRPVAAACKTLGLRLVVAHCGGLDAAQAASIDAEIVTDYVDQRAMLRQATICVTHGGLNTALDAVEAGVPMLVLPMAFDQPGVAARVVHHGIGLALPPRKANRQRVEAALLQLMADPGFARNAVRVGRGIETSGGAAEAARLAEVLCGGQPLRMDRAG